MFEQLLFSSTMFQEVVTLFLFILVEKDTLKEAEAVRGSLGGMDATQVITDPVWESDEEEEPLAKLRVLENPHIPETEFPLFSGENVLGRDSSTSSLVFSASTVSQRHATISVYQRRGQHDKMETEALVWDHGSMNGTRKGRVKLTPNRRYALSEGDRLMVADILCQYVSCSGNLDPCQADFRTPVSKNSEVKAWFLDCSGDAESHTSTGSKCRNEKLVSFSDSHLSSPSSSTFSSPADKIVLESEVESPFTPSSSTKSRPLRHVSFTVEEVDEDGKRQRLDEEKTPATTRDCKEESGGEEERASRDGPKDEESGQQATVQQEKSSLGGEADSTVASHVIPAFNMDVDTDVEEEEEDKVVSQSTIDQPRDSVHFHMDSDTDIDEDEEALKEAPKMDSNDISEPNHVNPVIQPEAFIMDSDTDVEEDSAVPDAATKDKSDSKLKDFHLDSDTDVEEEEEEEEECGPKMNLDMQLVRPESSSATHETPVVAAVQESHTATDADLDILSDSDTDVEDNVAPLVVPAAIQNISGCAGTSSKPPELDFDADRDMDEPSVPHPADIRVESDTDVEDVEMDHSEAGDDQRDNTPGRLLNPICSTPLQLQVSEEEVENMETQDFTTPSPGVFRRPSVRPAVLSTCAEDLAVAEMPSFILQSRDFTNSVDSSQTSIDKKQEQPSREESFMVRLSDSSDMQSHDQETQDFTTDRTSSEYTRVQGEDEELAKGSSESEKEGQEDLALLATQQYIAASSNDLGDNTDEDDRQNTDETQPSHFGISSTLAMAETELMPYFEEKERLERNIPDCSAQQVFPRIQNETENREELEEAETQPMCTNNVEENNSFACPQNAKMNPLQHEKEQTLPISSLPETEPVHINVDECHPTSVCEGEESDGADQSPTPQKRKAKQHHTEEEDSEEVTNSEHSVAQTQPTAPCKEDDSDSAPGVRKRKARPLQIEDESQSLVGSEVSTVDTQPFSVCQGEQREESDFSLGRRKRKAKPLQIEDESQSLVGSQDTVVVTQPLNTCKGEKDDEETQEMIEKTDPLVKEGTGKQSGGQNCGPRNRNLRETRASSMKQEEQVECSLPPKRQTRGQRKTLSSTTETRAKVDEDDKAQELKRSPRLGRKKTNQETQSANLRKAKEEQEKMNTKNKKEHKGKLESDGTQEGGKLEKEKKARETKEEEDEPQTPLKGRRAGRRVAAQSTTEEAGDAISTRRTRSRSDSSNSERSASSVNTQEIKGRGRGRGRGRGAESQTTTPRGGGRRTRTAAGLANMDSSLNPVTPSPGGGPKSRGRGRKTENLSNSRPAITSQGDQNSVPNDCKGDAVSTSSTRGRRKLSGDGPKPPASHEEDPPHTEERCAGGGTPRNERRGRGQKAVRSETVGDAVVPTVGDEAKNKKKGRQSVSDRSCSPNSSKETKQAPNSEAAEVDEMNDALQEKTRGSRTQAKSSAKESPPNVKVDTVKRRAGSRQSAIPKKEEEPKEQESETPTRTSRVSRKLQAPTDSSPVAKRPRTSSANQTYRVLFTGVVDKAGERVLVRLGGIMAKSVADMNCLVTNAARRTVKFLCAVARGIPVVTTEWLEKSGKAGRFLSPDAFQLKDPESEKKFNFCLQESLRAASSQPLLQSYEIHVTKSVMPPPNDMKDIILSSGAKFLPKMPSSNKPNTLVISCKEDWPLCRPAVAASLNVVTVEFILSGVLQQKLPDHVTHKLSPPQANP